MKTIKKQNKKKQPKTKGVITKDALQTYYEDVPEVGKVYPVQSEKSPRNEVEVLSVTMTHVFARFTDTGISSNVPHWIFRKWLRTAKQEAKAE